MNLTKSQEVHNILEQIREVVEKHAKTPQEYDSLMLDINELEEDIINILKWNPIRFQYRLPDRHSHNKGDKVWLNQNI